MVQDAELPSHLGGGAGFFSAVTTRIGDEGKGRVGAGTTGAGNHLKRQGGFPSGYSQQSPKPTTQPSPETTEKPAQLVPQQQRML